MDWAQVSDGLTSGPYRIERIGSSGWRLFYKDHLVEETGSLAMAVADADTDAESRSRHRRMRRLLVILAVAAAGLLAVYPFRTEPNPAYTAAAAVVDRLAVIQAGVSGGTLTLEGVPTAYPGTGAAVVAGTAVVTEALGTDCYYITWGAGIPASRWVIPKQADCRPEVVVAERGNFIAGDQSLPPTVRTPGWFFPLVVLLVVVVLNAAIVLFNLATRTAHQTPA